MLRVRDQFWDHSPAMVGPVRIGFWTGLALLAMEAVAIAVRWV